MTHERISPTAWLVAYQRSLTNIPLAPEVFQELDRIVRETRSGDEIAQIEALKLSMSVMWEARFKMVNHALMAIPHDQVLEVAAGFSPRGLDMAKDPSLTYVEIDLPGLIAEKRRIVEAIVAEGKVPERPNFHLVGGNALNPDDMQAAARLFTGRPIAVACEGLLPYLDHAERATLARNIHTLLERFGGVWITPDIDVKLPADAFGAAGAQVAARVAQVAKITGVDVSRNRFESEEEARDFFEAQGFAIERHSLAEIADQMDLPDKTSPSWKAVERGVLFAMRVSH